MAKTLNAEQIEETVESHNFWLLLLAALGVTVAGIGLLGLISGLLMREAFPIVVSTIALSAGVLLTRYSFRSKLDEGLNPNLFQEEAAAPTER